MDTINWSNYNFNDFTGFCNALLGFEVSKKVKPFSATGRDGGIDASYSGSYDGQDGNWRFQFKFHTIARKQGFNSLKSELSSEIKKLKGEDFFVLITNVELLPQERQDLEDLFDSIKNDYAPKGKLQVWDGAKLQTLLIRHPLLFLWMDEGFETAQLQDYKTFFRKALDATEFVPYTLSNAFIGRNLKFVDLRKFLNSEKKIVLIEGEAGIGKTRLVVEFFKTDVDETNWAPLVLANKNINFDRLKKALSSGNDFIILIDDVHSYDAKDVADFYRLTEIFQGKVKLILTARSLEASKSLQQIREYYQGDIVKINLTTLERSETQAAFEPYISQGIYWHYIGDLINITYGRPVLIVAVLRAIHEHIRIEKIRETDFLKNYVNNYFNEFHAEFTKSTGISDLRSKRLLQNIALIEPFSFGDQHIAGKLSKLHEIPIPEINRAFQLLKDYSFVTGRYEQSIKPDYYSDIILQNITADDASAYLEEFGAQLDNIVINLSSVDDAGSDKGSFLNDTLHTYVGWIAEISYGQDIDDIRKISVLSRILNTVGRIVYVKPEIAQRAVSLYLTALGTDGHPIQKDFNETSKSTFSSDSLLDKVITILSRLLLLQESYSFVYDNSIKLFKLTESNKIFTIYKFTRYDVIEHFSLERQRYVISRLQKSDINNINYYFVRDVLKAMLALDFTTSEISPIDRSAFTITTYMLPESSKVKDFRLSVTDLLIAYYERPELSESKLETIKLILDIPRGIFATHRNTVTYRNDEEISRVLDFLENTGEKFGLLEQKEVLDKLFWFVYWGIPEQFVPQIDRIKDKLKPKSLAERLSQLFTSAEVSLLKNPNIHVYVAEQCDLIASSYTKEELAEGMLAFLEPQPYSPHYFWEFLRRLEQNHTAHALFFHDYLLKSGSQLYYQYASGILSTLRFEKDEQDAFWDRIQRLERLNTWQADNVILQAYGNRVPGTSKLLLADVETILRINGKDRLENNYFLARGLQTLIASGHADSTKIIAGYLNRVDQRNADMFFIWLSENKTASAELVKNLVLENTVRFHLSFEIERGLARVLKVYGIEVVFDYLVRRFNFKKADVISSKSLLGYSFLPSSENSHLFEDEGDKKINMFKLALAWYLEENDTGGHLFYGKDMLVYLQPGHEITSEIYQIYDKLLAEHGNKLGYMQRIADTLSIFHSKDSQLIALVIKIFNFATELKEADHEMYRRTTYSLSLAVTSVGVKSGTAGQPFPVDLDLRDLLIKEINQLPVYLDVRKFLNDVLKIVNNDIDRHSDYNSETW